MDQKHLIVDKRTEHARRNPEIRANEVNDDDRNIWPVGFEMSPVPSPTATNVRHDAMRGDSTKKHADFPIHDRDRMVAADLDERIGMLQQGKGLALADFIGLTRGPWKRGGIDPVLFQLEPVENGGDLTRQTFCPYHSVNQRTAWARPLSRS